MSSVTQAIKESLLSDFDPFDISSITDSTPKRADDLDFLTGVTRSSNPFDHFRDSVQRMGESMNQVISTYDSPEP